MPGLVVFGRRWGIASDDFVFPGFVELFVRVLWYVKECRQSLWVTRVIPVRHNDIICALFVFRWIGAMILFTYHKDHFDCNGRGVLHIYLVGLLVVLGLIILSLCAIVCVSAQGEFLAIDQAHQAILVILISGLPQHFQLWIHSI